MNIIYSNQIKFNNLTFSEYLNKKGYSHSFLKNEHNGIQKEFIITEGIQIGKLTDQILTDPGKANMKSELYPIARNIAKEIRSTFPFIDHFEKQVAFFGTATCGEFSMPVKGVLDYLLEEICLMDLKVTKSKIKDIDALVEHMGYKNQIWHYGKLSKKKQAYLMIYSIPDKKCVLKEYKNDSETNDFWMDKILKYGKVNQ